MKRSQISVLSRGGTGKCVLCGRREGTNALSKVKLFQFPPMGEPRRALWLNRCGLQPEALPSRAKICNVHFVSGETINQRERSYLDLNSRKEAEEQQLDIMPQSRRLFVCFRRDLLYWIADEECKLLEPEHMLHITDYCLCCKKKGKKKVFASF